jgi:WD40 repeat protein
MDLGNGDVKVVKGVNPGDFVGGTWISNCNWSPDGRWLAAVRDGRIVLIDATNVSRRKSFRASPKGPVHWSPDSKYLLFAKSQLSCIPYIFTESLEAIEVETGHKIPIKSAHCSIMVPVIGWLDSAIAQ